MSEEFVDYATDFRPETYEDVWGHEDVCESISSSVESGARRSYILAGPSGVGKTTIARIAAAQAGCIPRNLMEIDAARHSKVDDMRRVAENVRMRGMGASAVRVVIVDEAHRLSKAAWDSLLKTVEEPSSHLWWFFCTTEPGKIPNTIKTRCIEYTLRPVPSDDIAELITGVAEEEQLDIGEDVIDLVARKSDGSPRRALTYLAKVRECESRAEAARLLHAVDADEGGAVGDLCRALVKGTNWNNARTLVAAALEETDGESVRIIACAWFTKVLLGAKTDAKAARAASVLTHFVDPFPPQSSSASLAMAVAEVCVKV